MTLVLLHPLPFDGRIWPSGIRSLAARVVAPTLYGLGDTLEAWARAVAELAGRGPWILVGSSVGGSVAIEVARLAPERVGLLVLVGAKPGHRPDAVLRDEALRVLSSGGVEAGFDRYWGPLFAPGADPEVVGRARRVALQQDVEDVIRGVRVFHGRPDRSTFLEGLARPVLVVSGEHDRTPSGGRELAARLRRGTFRCVPDAGHYVPLEQPEALAAILRHVCSRPE